MNKFLKQLTLDLLNTNYNYSNRTVTSSTTYYETELLGPGTGEEIKNKNKIGCKAIKKGLKLVHITGTVHVQFMQKKCIKFTGVYKLAATCRTPVNLMQSTTLTRAVTMSF